MSEIQTRHIKQLSVMRGWAVAVISRLHLRLNLFGSLNRAFEKTE